MPCPKTRAYGSDAVLLAARESQYGNSPASGYTKLSFSQYAVGAERPLGYDPLLGQGRNAQDPFFEAVTVDGDLAIPFDLRAVGFWLYGLFGAPVSTDNGDGTFSHVFTAGECVPSLTLELGHTGLTTPIYYRHRGAKLDSLSFDMSRTGSASATVGVVAQGESEAAASLDGDPDSFALKRFSSGSGSIRINGGQLANVVGGRMTFSNNLERVETIRDDGLIDGADETEATAEGTVEVRFSTDTTIRAAVSTESPVALEYGFSIPGVEGYRLNFSLPRVFLPKKKADVSGPGGIQASYEWRAAHDPAAGHMLQVTLVNDVEVY